MLKVAFLVVTLLVPLAGCSSRPGPEVLDTVAALPDNAAQVKIYAVTTRNRVSPDRNVFDSVKAINANYAELTVSIPPTHKPAQIEWPKGRKANPATDFAITGQSVLSQAQFAAAIAPGKASSSHLGIFVHGYNYNFQESLYRLAQLSYDAKLQGTMIAFSWPSQAAVAGYVADKESATYSRDYLAALMIQAVKERGGDDVIVFGHSMGGWLVVEALRQLKFAGRDDVLDKLTVVLAAPDIDSDVFRTQMLVIGKMKHPLTVLVSGDDKALAVSRLISASTNRVGTLDVNDPKIAEAAAQAGVALIDISQVHSSDKANHSRFVDLVGLYPSLAANNERQDLRKAGAFVFNAAGATISSPFRIVGGVLSQ